MSHTFQSDKKLLLYLAGITSLIVCLALLSYDDFIYRSFEHQPRVSTINPHLGYIFLFQGVLLIVGSWIWLKIQKNKGNAPVYEKSFVKKLDRVAMLTGVGLFALGLLIALAVFVSSLLFLASALPYVSIGFFVAFLGLLAILTTFTMPIVQKPI